MENCEMWTMQSKEWYNIKHMACANENETYYNNNCTRVKCKICNMQKWDEYWTLKMWIVLYADTSM